MTRKIKYILILIKKRRIAVCARNWLTTTQELS
jgi:hypothetical protein